MWGFAIKFDDIEQRTARFTGELRGKENFPVRG
jgi:hypothetical protein